MSPVIYDWRGSRRRKIKYENTTNNTSECLPGAGHVLNAFVLSQLLLLIILRPYYDACCTQEDT